MYLCKSLTNASLVIGKSFGGKHHSIIHSIRKIEDFRKKDSAFNSLVNTLIESIRPWILADPAGPEPGCPHAGPVDACGRPLERLFLHRNNLGAPIIHRNVHNLNI